MELYRQIQSSLYSKNSETMLGMETFISSNQKEIVILSVKSYEYYSKDIKIIDGLNVENILSENRKVMLIPVSMENYFETINISKDVITVKYDSADILTINFSEIYPSKFAKDPIIIVVICTQIFTSQCMH